MKSLRRFVNEQLMIVESTEPSFFLLSFEEAKKYFETYGILDDKNTKKCGLTLGDLEYIYEYAENNSMPCPIVANYQRKPGKFVFRRWVEKLNDELDIDLNKYKTAGFYQGLHNTNLKEDGKFFPSSEDFEYVIAYSHNKVNLGVVDPDNIEFVSSKEFQKDSKLEQLMSYFVANEEACIAMSDKLKHIDSELYKLPNETLTTSEWSKLGDYKRYGKKPNKTPKTDIISKDNKYKISLKKTGGAQLMSGSECETRATLLSCIDYITNEEDKELLNNILKDSWYKPDNNGKTIGQMLSSGDEELMGVKASLKKMTSDLNGIIERNSEFKRAVLYESATGEVKFGKDSQAAANYVFVWDDRSNKSKLYDMDEYIDHCLNTAKFGFGFKTANNRSLIVLRIMTK